MLFNLTLILSFLLVAMVSCNEKMNNYMKRTGKKYLDEKAKEDSIYKLKSGMQMSDHYHFNPLQYFHSATFFTSTLSLSLSLSLSLLLDRHACGDLEGV